MEIKSDWSVGDRRKNGRERVTYGVKIRLVIVSREQKMKW